MKAIDYETLADLVTRTHAVLNQRPGDELGTKAWTILFKTMPVPAVLDAQVQQRLGDWFSERIDGLAPALAQPCDQVCWSLFDDCLTHLAAAECSLHGTK